ncbi:phosphatase [Candidatus Allofournierella merdavium]|uniref:phosphatase n=1 Tax=Candidatus Allofournierella merdavium TaxID=2838593 RepID=UPI00374F278C
MKQSTFVALVLMLAAGVGALTAAWLYVRRREKELDEYEQLLFSEDMDDEEAPAEDAAASAKDDAEPDAE